MLKNKKIAAIIPTFNEMGKIQDVLRRIPRDLVDLIIVSDDCSTDGTPEFVSTIDGVVVIRNQRRSGVGSAIRNGYIFALRDGADVLCVFAGNNKDFPEDVENLITPIVENEADFVQGSRYLHSSREFGPMPKYRLLATRKVHPLLMSIRCKKRLSESTNGFRAVRSSLLEDPRIRLNSILLNKYSLEPYLLMKAIKLGYRHLEVPARKVYPQKHLGQTKMVPVISWWSILWIAFAPLWVIELGRK